MNSTIDTIGIWLRTAGYFLAFVAFDYLGIPQQQLTILGVLMAVDVFTGIMKSRKLYGKQSITSEKWVEGILKKIMVIILVFTLASACKGVSVGDFNIDPKGFLEFALSVLIMAESYSIVQNIYIQLTGKAIHEYDAISFVVKRLGDILLAGLKLFLDKFQEFIEDFIKTLFKKK